MPISNPALSVQMSERPPDLLTFDDYGLDEEQNQDESGFARDKHGIVAKQDCGEYYDSERDVDRDDPDAMRPHAR